MRNQFNGKSYLDEQLKHFDNGIVWDERSKKLLENKIVSSMDSRKSRSKVFSSIKYTLSIGVMAILVFFGYNILSQNIIYHDGEFSTGKEGKESTSSIITDEKDDEEEVKPQDYNDHSESGEENTHNGSNLEIHTDSSETVIRIVEGMPQEIDVINYRIDPYGITYQIDEVFGNPDVDVNQVNYSIQNGEYMVSLEMMEQTELDEAVTKLQERFETEGYNESFELTDTAIEENNLNGKMQFFGYPVKGFIAYEIGDHVLVITFRYPEVGGDGMYPLLKSLRESIRVAD